MNQTSAFRKCTIWLCPQVSRQILNKFKEVGKFYKQRAFCENVKSELVVKSTHCLILSNVNTSNGYFRTKTDLLILMWTNKQISLTVIFPNLTVSAITNTNSITSQADKLSEWGRQGPRKWVLTGTKGELEGTSQALRHSCSLQLKHSASLLHCPPISKNRTGTVPILPIGCSFQTVGELSSLRGFEPTFLQMPEKHIKSTNHQVE